MKKSIIFSIIVLMACTIQHSKAQTPDGCIEYIYQIPSYQVKDTVLPLGYGVSQIFSFQCTHISHFSFRSMSQR